MYSAFTLVYRVNNAIWYVLVHKCKYFDIGTFLRKYDDTIVLVNKYLKHIQKYFHGNQRWWVWWFIKHQHFSIVDNRLAMEKTNCFRLGYGTLAQHS